MLKKKTIEEATRQCSSCGVTKDINSFGTYSPAAKGPKYVLHRKRCKQCITEDQLEKRQEARARSQAKLVVVPKVSSVQQLPVLIKGASNVAF